MDKQHFKQLMNGVQEMRRHMSGKTVRGVKVTELPPPDVRTIREAAKISQSQFAKLIGVNLRTLQNWEQQRTQPTGPARALLKIIDDILDATADTATLGKTAGKDAKAGKTTYVKLHGLEASRRFADDCTGRALAAIQSLWGDFRR